MVETNDKHGFSRRLREAAVRFFARWLQQREIDVFEKDEVETLSDTELQVTPRGQVLWMKGERTIFDLFVERERELAMTRPKLSKELVRRVTGIRSFDVWPTPKAENALKNDNANEFPRRLILHPEPGIVLPALHWPGGEGTPVLIAPDNGMNSVVTVARQRHADGHPVLIVDARDIGETQTRNWQFYGADSLIGQMLGRNWLAMRAEDLLISARWLAKTEKRRSVMLSAHGELGPAATHAAFLEADLIGHLSVQGGLSSWRELMTDKDARHHVHQAVRGALQCYDLSDLRDAIGSPASP